MTTPEITIVVPAHNESASLAPLVAQLLKRMDMLAIRCEVVIVNDGSTDDTATVIETLASQTPQIKSIHFSRNFGKEAAMAAGMESALGQAVLFIDADMQHPPELIEKMVEAWRSGAHVVNAQKRTRSTEHFAYRWCARLFNQGMSSALQFDMSGASDYKLLDRKVVQALLDCPERVRFFRGLVAWVGFKQVSVAFDVAPRVAGQSSWSTRSLLRYTLQNLLAFSSAPLYWVAVMGFLMALLSFAMLLQTLYTYLFSNVAVGFTTVIALQVILGGMVLCALGVLAAYVGLIYEEVKRRPMYVINPSAHVGLSTVATQEHQRRDS